MKLIFLIFFILIESNLALTAQKHVSGHTINISGETVEIKIPGKNKLAEAKTRLDEIKLLENSMKTELKVYTLEMQNQHFISDNVITEVYIDTINLAGNLSLSVTYSYALLNDSLKFRTDDFAPGKYLVNESNALQVTLAVMKETIEGKLTKYIRTDKEISITITGSADAVPIRKFIPYNSEFGQSLAEDCVVEGEKRKMEVTAYQGIINNPSLAFLRSYAVRDYLQNNIFQSKYPGLKYHHTTTVSWQRGGQFRRVSIEMVILNAFK
jgi:hypothetical protein